MRNAWISGLMLAGLLAGGLASLRAADADTVIQASKQADKGFRALDRGQPDRARTAFEKALVILPSYPEGHVGLGHVALSAKRYEDALVEYRKAREGYKALGDLLFDQRMKRYQESRGRINDLERLLIQLKMGQDGSSESTENQFRITEIEVQLNELDNMPPPSRGTATEVPGELDFHVGNALARLERWDEAIEALESCLRKSPDFGAAYNNIALAYWRTGRVDEARKNLVKAEALGFEVHPRFKADLGL